MGFVDIPASLRSSIRYQLIIGLPEGCAWGIGGDNNIQPCQEEAIQGLLSGFQIKMSAEREGASRLQIFIKDLETEEIDMVTTGFQSKKGDYTFFAKGFCLAICSPDFDHRQPVLLFPRKSTKGMKKAVFCNLVQGGKALRVEEPENFNCLEALESLAPSFPDFPLFPSSSEDGDETMPSIDSYVDPQPPKETVAFDNLMARNNACLKRLGWSQEQGRDYLLRTYNKRSRQVLSDAEMIEFTEYLEGLVNSLDNSSDEDDPF